MSLSRMIPCTLAALAVSGCALLADADGAGGQADWTPTVLATATMPDPGRARDAWGAVIRPPTEADDPAAVGPAKAPYHLDTGDRLRVFIYGQPNLSRLYSVDHDGRISVPLIGHVRARGSSTRDLEQAIRARLGSQYVKDPQVTVDIAQNRPFYILGEVRNSGQYPYASGLTVQAAVAIAGGYSERANERIVQIARRNNGAVEKLDVPTDYLLQPGDTLYVYERWF